MDPQTPTTLDPLPPPPPRWGSGSEPEEDMVKLLAMDYQRVWLEEREKKEEKRRRLVSCTLYSSHPNSCLLYVHVHVF